MNLPVGKSKVSLWLLYGKKGRVIVLEQTIYAPIMHTSEPNRGLPNYQDKI